MSDESDDFNLGDIVPNPLYGSDRPFSGGAQMGAPMASPPAGQPAGQSQPRLRVVKPALPFWVNMAVPFTSVASENVTAFSKPVDFDLFVLGAWTQLLLAKVQFSLTAGGKDMSIEKVPVLSLAGASTKTNPISRWKPPAFLPAQSTVRGDFINDSAAPEATGRVVFLGYRRGSEQPIQVPQSTRYTAFIDISAAALTAATSPIDDPLLIWGAITNAGVAILGQFTDERSNYSWSSVQLPIRAFAGVQTEVSQIAYYPRPYFLPARARIRCDYSAAVAGNYVAFICERLTQWSQKPTGITAPPTPGQPPPSTTPQPPQAAPPRVVREWYSGPMSGDNDFTWRMQQAGWRWDNGRRNWYRDVTR